jgi:hypothetical protein
VTKRLPSALTALLLGAWMFPSLAATGTDIRSDESMDATPMSLSAGRELPIQVIDRGASGVVDSDSLPLDDDATETPADAAEPRGGPRVEIMLRRIFDEARAREPQLQQPREDNDFNAPLAVEKTETLEDPPRVLEPDPADATAELPGFGADELLHYRQQMYRTDI